MSSWAEEAIGRGARRLLARGLVVAGAPHRVLEVEGYLVTADHPDPFAHAHPEQATDDRWYLHRVGVGFRGGSYKGLDLTFGGPRGLGGLLVRTLETPDGRIVSGPSLVVDHLLEALGAADPAALHRRLGPADAPGPLRLGPASDAATSDAARERCALGIVWTARVGLSLRRAARDPALVEPMQRFFGRHYRAVDAPHRIPKGRAQMTVALHQGGASVAEIVARLGGRARHHEALVDAYERGRADPRAVSFESPRHQRALARLLGALHGR